MQKKLSIRKTKELAEDLFRKGEYYCSEAIVASIRENIAPEMPQPRRGFY